MVKRRQPFARRLVWTDIRCCSEKLSCCIQQGRAIADAAREYERALSLQPNDLNTRFNLGLVRNHLGQYEQAKMLLNEVVSENPRHARALYALGEALLNEGKEADARGYFEQTLEVDTTYAQAHVQIARLDMRDNDLAAAAQRLRRTILIEPGIAESFRLLGQIYLRQGRESAGEKSLEAYEKVKSFEKEIDYFRERLRADPDDGEAHYNLGFIYGRLGLRALLCRITSGPSR